MKKMINDIPKPTTSSDFTINDIHKIREWHYEILKDATPEEQKIFYRDKALSGLAQIEAIRVARDKKTA
jgi:hypothetical protein